MKKIYMQPMAENLGYTTATMVAVSESEIIMEKMHDAEIDGDQAWSRISQHHDNNWDKE
jgi:hypothetical protein